MKHKKVLIIISISILILLIITSITIFIIFNKKSLDNKDTKKDYISEEKTNIITKDKDITEEESTVKEDDSKNNDEIITNNNKNNNNPITNNSQNNNQNQGNQGGGTPPPPQPQPVYSCPGGYTLSGTQCISTIGASLTCPEGKHEFSDGNVSGCVNLSEGYITEDGTCPAGYGVIRMISFGAPDQYRCLPVYQKVYICPDGYSLSNTTCTSIIAATVN